MLSYSLVGYTIVLTEVADDNHYIKETCFDISLDSMFYQICNLPFQLCMYCIYLHATFTGLLYCMYVHWCILCRCSDFCYCDHMLNVKRICQLYIYGGGGGNMSNLVSNWSRITLFTSASQFAKEKSERLKRYLWIWENYDKCHPIKFIQGMDEFPMLIKNYCI